MLGARARAAEYHAFKAASARQASREAEEQKLPPKPAPVSLGAFTKNAQLNRNKGPKAWKPLVLEDTPEADDDNLEDNEGTFSTPTRLKAADRSHSASQDSDISLLPVNPRPLRSSDNTPSSVVPTAPRAMLRTSRTPSTLINPTPQRVRPHSIIRQTQQGMPPSVHSSPSNFSGMSGYPYPRLTWWYDLHGMPVLAPAPMPTFEPSPYPGDVMVPDDISPTKQENKLASLSYQYKDPPTAFVTSHEHFTSVPNSVGNSTLPPVIHYGDSFGRRAYPHADIPATNPVHQPSMQHVNSDSVVEMDGNISDSSPLCISNIGRHFSYPDAVGALLDQRRKNDQTICLTTQQSARLPVVFPPDDGPYDRKTKMQSFVAAQQALAKTGRTVLRRVKASEAASPARSGSAPTTPEHASHTQMCSSGSVAILKPPPGFGPQPTSRQTSEEDGSKKSSPLDEATLQQMFEVDREDWFELRPVTKTQRTKMNRVMRIFTRAQSPDEPWEFAHKTDKDREENLARWMQLGNRDNKPATATRKLFEQAAKERLSSRLPTGLSSNGAMSNATPNAEIECAAICAVGSIMANLMDGAGSLGVSTDSDALLYKYKPAPEYAIEKGRLLLGNAASTSFFEENTGGFYNAPSRIARDPRFRPAGKEAIKIKPEEDWKLRTDMYGRRRV